MCAARAASQGGARRPVLVAAAPRHEPFAAHPVQLAALGCAAFPRLAQKALESRILAQCCEGGLDFKPVPPVVEESAVASAGIAVTMSETITQRGTLSGSNVTSAICSSSQAMTA